MRMLFALIAVTALALPLMSAQAAEQSTRIEIDSRWNGMRPDAPLETKLTLVPEGDHYRMIIANSSFQKKQPLVTSHIGNATAEQLIAALEAPPQPQVVLGQLGLDTGEVSRLIEKTIEADKSFSATPERHKRMNALIRSAQTSSGMARVIANSLGFDPVDSYPSIDVTAELPNGSKLFASSNSSSPMMLPWKLGRARTYSPEVAKIVSRLLPTGSINQELLSSKFTAPHVLEYSIGAGLHTQIDRLRTENEAPLALHALASRFEVIDPSFLPPLNGDGPQLQTGLRSLSGPKNLVMSARLPLQGEGLLDEEKALNYLVEQFDAVRSAKALITRIKATPSKEFEMVYRIRFPPGWLDAATSAEFVHDMQALHKLPELNINPQLMKGAALVVEGLTFWIALPDHRTVLWKRSYDNAPASRGTMRCGEILDSSGKPYDEKPDLCIGEIFAADGDVVP